MKPGMTATLDVDFRHLTLTDINLIEDIRAGFNLPQAVTVYPYEDGFMIVTEVLATGTEGERAEKLAAMKEAGFSDELIALLKYCGDNGGTLARFDTGASLVLDDFPIFDHETGLEIPTNGLAF